MKNGVKSKKGGKMNSGYGYYEHYYTKTWQKSAKKSKMGGKMKSGYSYDKKNTKPWQNKWKKQQPWTAPRPVPAPVPAPAPVPRPIPAPSPSVPVGTSQTVAPTVPDYYYYYCTCILTLYRMSS